MGRAPWYKRFAADFVSDPYVQAMTAEQYGWYSAMLDYSWIHTPIGRLPNDLSLICRMIGRCDEMYFVQHSKIVIDRFHVSADGLWMYHPKLLEQAERVTQVSENKSHPGKSGRKREVKSDDFQKQIKRGVDSESEPDKSNTPLTPQGGNRNKPNKRRPRHSEATVGMDRGGIWTQEEYDDARRNQ